MSHAIKPPIGTDGLSALVAWVKAYKAQPGVMFDSGMKCETEGGEVFYIDPEEVEEWADKIDQLCPLFRKAHGELGDGQKGTEFSTIEDCAEFAAAMEKAQKPT